MAKVKKITYTMCGSRQEAEMRVDSSGQFSIKSPEEVEEALGVREIADPLAVECDRRFRELIRKYEARQVKVERVIALRVIGAIPPDVRHGFDLPSASHRDGLLDVAVAIVDRHTLSVEGGKDKVDFKDPPERSEFGCGEDPIPWPFRSDARSVNHGFPGKFTCIPWTQENQDKLTAMLTSLQSIVNLLAIMASTPDRLATGLSSGSFPLLPAPKGADHE